jgi:hypothetical protein
MRITPFGNSQGLTWDWQGPNGFTSCEQSPVINTEWVWGAYNLSLKEERNGCIARATMDISFRRMPTNPAGENLPLIKNNVWQNGNKLMLSTVQQDKARGKISIYSGNGQLLSSKDVQLVKGQNSFELPVQPSNQVRIVTLQAGKEIILTKKIIF